MNGREGKGEFRRPGNGTTSGQRAQAGEKGGAGAPDGGKGPESSAVLLRSPFRRLRGQIVQTAVLFMAAGAGGAVIQSVYDAAALHMIPRAGVPQCLQMGFEMLKRGYLTFDVGNVSVHQIVDPGAADRGIVLEGEKASYFGKVHAVKAAAADEVKPFDVALVIEAVVGARSLGPGQQPFLFIVAYGDDLTAGKFCQFSNFQRHDDAPCRGLTSCGGRDDIAEVKC